MSGDTGRILQLQEEVKKLKQDLHQKEKELFELQHPNIFYKKWNNESELSTSDVVRYSRQMLMSQISFDGQIALKNSKVLIVGIGGLGCPASLYLAAAGVGELTLLDSDEVELTNLHRQILHGETDVGSHKVTSAFTKLESINSGIKIKPIHMHANSITLSELFKSTRFDVVIDGSDNVATRYLLNDICVLNNIPLVSGSALQMEGQLTVYHYENGPCYRCLFPVPPPVETVTSCGDGGVLGVVPGIIGLLQALETIKILTNQTGILSGRLLTFDGCDTTFRNIKLRQRNSRCSVCGDEPTITKLIDYEQFCGAGAHDKVLDINILKPEEHIDVKELNSKTDLLLIDVRPKLEYAMCSLPNSFNFPYGNLQKNKDLDILKEKILENCNNADNEVLVICRRGNDSQRAIVRLKDAYAGLPVKFLNVRGGLHLYSKMVDTSFPKY